MTGLGWELVLGLMGGLLVLLMGIGVPVAFAFLGLNLVGAYFILGGEAGLRLLALSTTEAVSSFTLVPIPLFVLMGEVLLHTGLATRAIHAIERLITGVPARLSLVAVVSGSVFASLSGSSIANTAVLGRVLLPDMLRLGYRPVLSIGPILGIGGVAMLIPPSALAVLFGSLAGIPISRLLLAGVVPGMMLAALFFLFIVVIARARPELAPAAETAAEPLASRLRPFIIYVLPLMTIVVVVVGSILGGYATPTESAALGSIGTVAIAAAYRSLSWTAIRRALTGTAATTASIFIIISGSITFSQILSFSGVTRQLVAAITALEMNVGMVVVIMLLAVIAVCFAIQLAAASPPIVAILGGFIPKTEIVTNPAMLYIAIGIIGATVMPHNLYLHSSIVQTRAYERNDEGRRDAIKWATVDSTIALMLALFINAAILIIAAAVFHTSGNQDVAEIQDAHRLLSPLLGLGIASTLFAVALLASGVNSIGWSPRLTRRCPASRNTCRIRCKARRA